MEYWINEGMKKHCNLGLQISDCGNISAFRNRKSKINIVWFILSVMLLWHPTSVLADIDVGDIAVIEADATIIPEGFDLDGTTLEFTPKTGGGYDVTSIPFIFESNTGADLGLGDDDSASRSLGFPFPFFGVDQITVFIGSNGFVNFTGPSTRVSESLGVFAINFPRIAVLWDDLDPGAGGSVLFNGLADRVIITWQVVPEFGTLNSNTFQVVIFNDGTIRMSYNGVDLKDGLVGVSPGGVSELLGASVDFTAGPASSVITGFPDSLLIAQVFADPADTTFIPTIPIQAIARKFYQSHGDDFDQLVMIANFAHSMGGAFEFDINRSVEGIGLPLFEFTEAYGSAGRLQSVLNMNRLDLYPADPNQDFLRTNNTLDVMGQESGHQWLAFVEFDDGGVDSTELLGRTNAHWSFFHDTDASDMEGNSWVDNGDGSFTTDEATERFSALDQYIMGLRTPAEVSDFFFIDSPSGTHTPASAPEIGVTVSGTRQDVSVNQVIASEGARVPASGFSAMNPTNVHHQAFILLIRPGTTASPADISKWDTIRAAWIPYFAVATGNRGSIDTNLGAVNQTPVNLATAVLPSSRSVQVGVPATAFVTIINAGATTATGVGISLKTAIPATLDYQTTDSATNFVTGMFNTPVDVPAGGIQSFVIGIAPTAAFSSPTVVEFNFSGTNTTPVSTIPGVNTLLLSASDTPVPDVVALVATINNDGIVNIPGAAGTGVFSVATVNIGAGSMITASADTGGVSLPVNISICETNPLTGVCLSPPSNSVATQIDTNATPTFGIFVEGIGSVPFDPAVNRVFVRFADSGGVTRGSTSVAVRTVP